MTITNLKKIVIVGATSSIAEYCAREWVGRCAVELHLVGRDYFKLAAIRNDLNVRSKSSKIFIYSLDFSIESEIFFVAQYIISTGRIDILLLAQGLLVNQELLSEDQLINLHLYKSVLEVNIISVILFIEAFALDMEKNSNGTIAIMSSVAGDRARKANYIYGASKNIFIYYINGLNHRFAAKNINTVLIKLGPTDTKMTAILNKKFLKLASVSAVANSIVNAIELGQKSIYIPSKWRLIMFIIRSIPNFIFNRTNL